MILQRFLSFIIGYAFGCISPAYLLAKANGIDMKQEGSGNLGATNSLRVLGKKAGIIVFVCDMLKAAIPAIICALIFGKMPMYDNNNQLFMAWAALGAMMGHCFPFYLKFKGGKGVSCMMGAFTVIDFRLTLICFFAFLIVVLITKYVSLGSIAGAFLFFVGWLVFGFLGISWVKATCFFETSIILGFICLLMFYLHRSNIKRLFEGTESKITDKRS